MKQFIFISAFIFATGCVSKKPVDASDLSTQLIQAEEAFEKYVAEKGEKAGYLEFADDSATMNRNGRIYKGKKEIAEYFDNRKMQLVSLIWKTDFAEASASGDLGYTYGKFKMAALDSAGRKFEHSGIFHSVWKKQPGGSWKLVYD